MSKSKSKAKSEYPRTEVELTPEMLSLLANFTPEEIETGIIDAGRPPEAGSHTIQDLLGAYHDAVVEDAIGDMLRIARERHRHSFSEAATRLGVSRARAHQLEQSNANLRVNTLCRIATAYGYKVQVALVPVDGNEPPIVAELSDDSPDDYATAN